MIADWDPSSYHLLSKLPDKALHARSTSNLLPEEALRANQPAKLPFKGKQPQRRSKPPQGNL